MVKFKSETASGKTLLGFGISAGNVERLKKGEPIYFELDEMGIPGVDVTIFYGETEQAMYRELKAAGAFGPETKININPRLT